MTSSEIRAEIYDRFQDYVRDKMRDSDNPNISLRDFDKLQEGGLTHFDVPLENISGTKKKYFDLVDAFAPGAMLKTRKSVVDGSEVVYAQLPFRTKKVSFAGKHGKNGSSNLTLKMFSCMFLWFVSLMLAVIYTEKKDWWMFF